jgi:hypothetical protein
MTLWMQAGKWIRQGAALAARGYGSRVGLWLGPIPLKPWDDTIDMPHADCMARERPRPTTGYCTNPVMAS